MGSDRFVNWKQLKPTRSEVRTVLEDYLSGMAVSIEYGTFENGKSRTKDMEFWAVHLVGVPSFPFKRLPELVGRPGASMGMEIHKERWFEVVVTDEGIDVITRMCDEMTSVIANGFVDLCARYWQTHVER